MYFLCLFPHVFIIVLSLFLSSRLFLLCRFGPPYLIEYVPKHTGNHCFMVLKVDDLIMFVMVTLVETIRIYVMVSVSFSRTIYINICLFIIITSVCIIIVSTHTHIHTSGNPGGRFLVFRFRL